MILTNKHGIEFIVDDDLDFDLKNRRWQVIYKRKIPYVVTGIWNKETKTTDIFYLHRLLMNAKKGQFVDHINGNTLDNRKSNLRICSNSENVRNKNKSKSNTSGYKGVYKDKRNLKKRYQAKIMLNKKTKHLGYFYTAKEAAKAYDEAAIKFHKEFAKLNFLNK